jgi:hypothetical protein
MITMLLLSHKICGFQGHVGRCVVLRKKPVVVAPQFPSLSSHIFSQGSQNAMVQVNVRVDHSVRRNKFTANNRLHVEKKTMSMLFVELPTCHAFFALRDCGFFHCDD